MVKHTMDNSNMGLSPCLSDETDGSQPVDFLQLSHSFGSIGSRSFHSKKGSQSFDDDAPRITFNPSMSVEVTLGRPSSSLMLSPTQSISQHSRTSTSETPTQNAASCPTISDEIKVPPSIPENESNTESRMGGNDSESFDQALSITESGMGRNETESFDEMQLDRELPIEAPSKDASLTPNDTEPCQPARDRDPPVKGGNETNVSPVEIVSSQDPNDVERKDEVHETMVPPSTHANYIKPNNITEAKLDGEGMPQNTQPPAGENEALLLSRWLASSPTETKKKNPSPEQIIGKIPKEREKPELNSQGCSMSRCTSFSSSSERKKRDLSSEQDKATHKEDVQEPKELIDNVEEEPDFKRQDSSSGSTCSSDKTPIIRPSRSGAEQKKEEQKSITPESISFSSSQVVGKSGPAVPPQDTMGTSEGGNETLLPSPDDTDDPTTGLNVQNLLMKQKALLKSITLVLDDLQLPRGEEDNKTKPASQQASKDDMGTISASQAVLEDDVNPPESGKEQSEPAPGTETSASEALLLEHDKGSPPTKGDDSWSPVPSLDGDQATISASHVVLEDGMEPSENEKEPSGAETSASEALLLEHDKGSLPTKGNDSWSPVPSLDGEQEEGSAEGNKLGVAPSVQASKDWDQQVEGENGKLATSQAQKNRAEPSVRGLIVKQKFLMTNILNELELVKANDDALALAQDPHDMEGNELRSPSTLSSMSVDMELKLVKEEEFEQANEAEDELEGLQDTISQSDDEIAEGFESYDTEPSEGSNEMLSKQPSLNLTGPQMSVVYEGVVYSEGDEDESVISSEVNQSPVPTLSIDDKVPTFDRDRRQHPQSCYSDGDDDANQSPYRATHIIKRAPTPEEDTKNQIQYLGYDNTNHMLRSIAMSLARSPIDTSSRHALIFCDIQMVALNSIEDPKRRAMIGLWKLLIAAANSNPQKFHVIHSAIKFSNDYREIPSNHKLYGALKRLNEKTNEGHGYTMEDPDTQIMLLEGGNSGHQHDNRDDDGGNEANEVEHRDDDDDDDGDFSEINKDTTNNPSVVWRSQHMPNTTQLSHALEGCTHATVVGIMTGQAIQSTVQAVCDMGLRVSVIPECIADDDQSRHCAILDHLLPVYANVVPIADWLDQELVGGLDKVPDLLRSSNDVSSSSPVALDPTLRYFCDCQRDEHAFLYAKHLAKRHNWSSYPAQMYISEGVDRARYCPLGKPILDFCDEPQFSKYSICIKGREWLNDKDKLLCLVPELMPATYVVRHQKMLGHASPECYDKEECYFIKDIDKNERRKPVTVCGSFSHALALCDPHSSYILQPHIPNPLLTSTGHKCHLIAFFLLKEHAGEWTLHMYPDAYLSKAALPWRDNSDEGFLNPAVQITSLRNVRLSKHQESSEWVGWPMAYEAAKELMTTVVKRAVTRGKLRSRLTHSCQFELFSADILMDTTYQALLLGCNFGCSLFDPSIDQQLMLTTDTREYQRQYELHGDAAVVNDHAMIEDTVGCIYKEYKAKQPPQPEERETTMPKRLEFSTTRWEVIGQFSKKY